MVRRQNRMGGLPAPHSAKTPAPAQSSGMQPASTISGVLRNSPATAGAATTALAAANSVRPRPKLTVISIISFATALAGTPAAP